jgi:hypothetical protein
LENHIQLLCTNQISNKKSSQKSALVKARAAADDKRSV